MKFARASGILLHPTSLAGGHGVGDLGEQARRFVDFVQAGGHKLWQVLPLNPTGYGDSPFQCFSASAGNPLLINLELLVEKGVLSAAELKDAPEFKDASTTSDASTRKRASTTNAPMNEGAGLKDGAAFPADRVDYHRAIEYKMPRLKRAAQNFLNTAEAGERRRFEGFCQANGKWLDDFALFMACKEAHGMAGWTKWAADIAGREPRAVQRWSEKLGPEMAAIKYWQFEFSSQWQEVRGYARERGIRIIGDVPIYVAHDSADVWTNRELFCLDERGEPTKVAGVPPDYFSATGQLWGNPIYDWARLEQTGYRWWIERFRAALRLYDIVRIDHFRGFEAYFEIEAGEATAVHGRWVKGPGAKLFAALQAELGEMPIIAENLGVITPEVEAIRKQFGLPGMAILQFGFGNDPQAPTFRPHNYERNLVAYTGTHDNDTTMGWWMSQGADDSVRTPEEVVKEHGFARAYLGAEEEGMHWAMMRAVLASVADTAMIPMQDVLGLGSGARMNLPGTSSGNWKWRMVEGALAPELAERLREMNAVYDR